MRFLIAVGGLVGLAALGLTVLTLSDLALDAVVKAIYGGEHD